MIKLSDCEINIMQVIWEKGEATSFDIIDRVKDNKRLAQNTVRTLLARMVKKQAIAVKQKIGKVYIYESLINKEEFMENEAINFLEIIYDGDIKTLLANYVKNNKITEKDLKAVLSEIKK